MVNNKIIKAKVMNINHNLQRLDTWKQLTFSDFEKNVDAQESVLYNLQIAIQGCIDIATHITSYNEWALPGTVAGLFDELAEHEILQKDTAESMRAMVGFRNFIVHEYDKVDLNKVYTILQNKLQDISAYISQIVSYTKL